MTMGNILAKVRTHSFPMLAQRKMWSDFIVVAQECKFPTQARNEMRKLILMKHLLAYRFYKWETLNQDHCV